MMNHHSLSKKQAMFMLLTNKNTCNELPKTQTTSQVAEPFVEEMFDIDLDTGLLCIVPELIPRRQITEAQQPRDTQFQSYSIEPRVELPEESKCKQAEEEAKEMFVEDEEAPIVNQLEEQERIIILEPIIEKTGLCKLHSETLLMGVVELCDYLVGVSVLVNTSQVYSKQALRRKLKALRSEK